MCILQMANLNNAELKLNAYFITHSELKVFQKHLFHSTHSTAQVKT